VVERMGGEISKPEKISLRLSVKIILTTQLTLNNEGVKNCFAKMKQSEIYFINIHRMVNFSCLNSKSIFCIYKIRFPVKDMNN